MDLREADGGVTLRVRVQPRAARDEVSGTRQGALLVRLTASPVEGKANAALARFLGKNMGLPPSSLELVHGAAGRDKLVLLRGVTLRSARERLVALLGETRS